MCIIAVEERHEKPETDREETVKTPPKGNVCASGRLVAIRDFNSVVIIAPGLQGLQINFRTNSICAKRVVE